MIDLDRWMTAYRDRMLSLFGRRILLIGLQGSYGRGEAEAGSDIDVVLILDQVGLADLEKYRVAIRTLPESGKICGFVSGRAELANWCRFDLFQFYHDTVPVYGSLDGLINVTAADAAAAVQAGACSLYHLCSHNFLHQGDMGTLRGLYKTALFVLRAKVFCETGQFQRRRSELQTSLTPDDAGIMRLAGTVKTAADDELSAYTQPLLEWSSRLISEYRADSRPQ